VHLFFQFLRYVVVLEGPQIREPAGVLVAEPAVRREVVLVQDKQRAPHVVQIQSQLLGELLIGYLAVRGRCRDRHPRRADELVEVLLNHRILQKFLVRHY